MDVRIKFLGAAKSVTGSKYLLEIDDFNLLVDCGLFQGLKELRLRNWSPLPIAAEKINAVVLTHAHATHLASELHNKLSWPNVVIPNYLDSFEII